MLLTEALPPRACAGVPGGLSNLQKSILSPWAPGHLTQTSEGTPTVCPVYPQAVSCPACCCCCLTLPPAVWKEGKGASHLSPPPPGSNRSSSLSGQNRTARAFVSSSYLGYEGSGSFRLLAINKNKNVKYYSLRARALVTKLEGSKSDSLMSWLVF